jgi:hypothetical protein
LIASQATTYWNGVACVHMASTACRHAAQTSGTLKAVDTNRISYPDSGYFRNRGCRNHKFNDDSPVKSIGNRLGRDSVAAGSVVSLTDRVPLKCIAILFEATAIYSFLFVEGISLKRRCLLAMLRGLGRQIQKIGSLRWRKLASAAISDNLL